ncbi:hypothetical protein FB99_25670 [Pantoea agglomerans]|nr:hypothetical protein FB99_25670 [Pantoea agglomerans]
MPAYCCCYRIIVSEDCEEIGERKGFETILAQKTPGVSRALKPLQ